MLVGDAAELDADLLFAAEVEEAMKSSNIAEAGVRPSVASGSKRGANAVEAMVASTEGGVRRASEVRTKHWRRRLGLRKSLREWRRMCWVVPSSRTERFTAINKSLQILAMDKLSQAETTP